jgi:predicted  nucleic acid-binding Zn-ribbon protein
MVTEIITECRDFQVGGNNMADQTQELLKIKNHIAESKSKADQITGQISQLEKQRAEEFGCSTDEEANTYIQELEKGVAALGQEIDEGVQTVKTELGW